MCVVAVAIKAHPKYPIILIGNRDEFHARPAAPLQPWQDGSGIMAGRDLEAGGTWLGAHPQSGRITVVTNVRGSLPDPEKASRGALVMQLLSGSGPYAAPAEDQLNDFNAFNLLHIHDGEAQILTNRPALSIKTMREGIFALANEPAFTPCPRAERLKNIVAQSIADGSDPEELLLALRLTDPPVLFLNGDIYGTRASTLLLQDHHGELTMMEHRYEAGGHSIGMTALKSHIGSAS